MMYFNSQRVLVPASVDSNLLMIEKAPKSLLSKIMNRPGFAGG